MGVAETIAFCKQSMTLVQRGIADKDSFPCARGMKDFENGTSETDVRARINALILNLNENSNNSLYINYRLGKAISLYKIVNGATWDQIDEQHREGAFNWCVLYFLCNPNR
jgi:hypothetical protein